MKKYLLSIATTFIFFHGFSQENRTLEKLDSFVTTAMKDWHVMGLSLAIVKKDSVLLTKAYGYRDFEKQLNVTNNTVFPIASCSKTFTSALIGMAYDDGKIKLDQPVHKYLPQFSLQSDELTRDVTIENLLSHTSGIPGHDWAWTFNTNYPEQVYLERIKYLDPASALHTKYQYNSFMFFALSVLAEKTHQKKWNELLKEKIFEPLEMKQSYGNSRAAKDCKEIARTYEFDSIFHVNETKQMDDLLGGGALLSTVPDLGHWLQMWINGGSYNGHRILSENYITQSISPRAVVEETMDKNSEDEPLMNMGLSWFLSSYRGHYKAHHTGNVAGYSSSISFFPFDSIGIVVLTNQNNSPLIRLIPNYIADVLFDLPVRDNNSYWLAQFKAYKSRQQKPPFLPRDSIVKTYTSPTRKFCGIFYHPGYGPVTTAMEKNMLVLTYSDLQLVLVPKPLANRFSSYILEDGLITSREVGDVQFYFDKTGKLQSFSIPFEPATKDIVFIRK